jgi:ABC-type branched-subunit amino acid transport system ATPase component
VTGAGRAALHIGTVAERIQGLRAARGLSVLLVEQNLDFIRALSDRALLIQRGRIVRGLPAAGLADPAPEHEFTA